MILTSVKDSPLPVLSTNSVPDVTKPDYRRAFLHLNLAVTRITRYLLNIMVSTHSVLHQI